MKWLLGIISLFIVIAAVLVFVIPAKAPSVSDNGGTTTNPPAKAQLEDLIVVNTPLPSAKVGSPLAVTGQARGSWYFEASFPYQLKNASGVVIAEGHAQALSDWMTTDFVPFAITINYPAQPSGSTGTLILKNDNPSGDPARDKSLTIPVMFQ